MDDLINIGREVYDWRLVWWAHLVASYELIWEQFITVIPSGIGCRLKYWARLFGTAVYWTWLSTWDTVARMPTKTPHIIVIKNVFESQALYAYVKEMADNTRWSSAIYHIMTLPLIRIHLISSTKKTLLLRSTSVRTMNYESLHRSRSKSERLRYY